MKKRRWVFTLTGHPLNRYLNELAKLTTCRIARLHPSEHQTARVAGIITNIRTRQTKRGDRIAIFTLDDGTTQIEVVCFSECFQKYRPLLNEDQLIIVDGEVSLDDFSNTARIIARELGTLDQAREKFAKYMQVHLPMLPTFDIQHLKRVLTQHAGGNCPVVLRYLRDNIQTDIRLGKNWLIKPTESLLALLREELSIDNVTLIYEG